MHVWLTVETSTHGDDSILVHQFRSTCVSHVVERLRVRGHGHDQAMATAEHLVEQAGSRFFAGLTELLDEDGEASIHVRASGTT